MESNTTESQYAKSLIEASIDPLITIRNNGKIMDMNDAFINISGMARDNQTKVDFLNCFTDPGKAKIAYLEVLDHESVINIPLSLRHKNGNLTYVLFNAIVYKDQYARALGMIIILRDITEQRKIASEFTEAIVFAELATGIAEDAKLKADEARNMAEDAVKSKQRFLSNMSHEIRTPMNAIIGFTKVLLKTELQTKQREYLSAIKTSGDALIVLINDILDLAKVDEGKMNFEEIPFNISASISSIIHLFELKIYEKNLNLIKEFDKNIPKILLGDPLRLHQILINLISNAIKFTSKGSIKIGLRLLDDDEDMVLVEFEVTDTGIGIEKDKLHKIFENFQQATSGTSRLFGGTGLGLAISKQLVQAQGGSISVESDLEKGSTFTFSLSFKKTNKILESEPIAELADATLQIAKVLVVEDIALNQLLMKTLLDDFGFECAIAENGKVAVEMVRSNNYDIILMDLQMPEMNGFEATEYIREHLNATIPIIALTADVTTADLARCKLVGMNDYVSKPIDEKLLERKMRFFLNSIDLQNQDLLKEESTNRDYRFINLQYLKERTKSDSQLMTEMISLYLGQTQSLIKEMKESSKHKNWKELYKIAHKLIPSFSIVGLSHEHENLAKKLQEYARNEENTEEIQSLVLQLGKILNQACQELELEIKHLNNSKI